MGKSKKNVCWNLFNRQVSVDLSRKKDCKILRTLICHSDRKFTKCWSETSKTRFTYECGRLFSENFKTCHFGYSVSGGPVTLYKRHHEPACKLEDALIYRAFHENFHLYDNKGYLFVIESRTGNDSLVQYSLDTGQPCQRILLSNTIHFKRISWVDQNEMLVVTSKQMQQMIRFHGQDALPVRNTTTVMAVFTAFPFDFVGMFEIDKRIFGNGFTAAMLTQSLLILLYSSGHTRCYSFKYILENYKLFDHSINRRSVHPDCELKDGLPMNIKITECPPVLFEVRCQFNDMKIGGFPWHYIIQPYGMGMGTFTIHDMRNHKKAKQGTLSSTFMWAEADFCGFHNDSSGRILHLRAPEIGVYSITPLEDSVEQQRYKLTTQTVINLQKETKQEPEEVIVTFSGRRIRQRQFVDQVDSDQDVVIQQLDYEDDLDLTWVALQCRNQEKPNIVNFYDNASFRLEREIPLESKYEETLEYFVYVDLDTIIQIAKPHHNRYICTLYRLSGSESPSDSNPSRKTSRTGSKQRDNNDSSLTSSRVTRTRTLS